MHRPAQLLQITDGTGHNCTGIVASAQQGNIAVGNGKFDFSSIHMLYQLFRGQIIMEFDGKFNPLFLDFLKSFLVRCGRSHMNGFAGKILQFFNFSPVAPGNDMLLDIILCLTIVYVGLVIIIYLRSKRSA